MPLDSDMKRLGVTVIFKPPESKYGLNQLFQVWDIFFKTLYFQYIFTFKLGEKR